MADLDFKGDLQFTEPKTTTYVHTDSRGRKTTRTVTTVENLNTGDKIVGSVDEQKGVGVKGILGLVFGILLFVTLVRVSMGSANFPTFTGFLEMLTTVPEVSIPFVNTASLSLPGWLSWLSVLIEPINIGIFFINAVGNLVVYIVYFAKWLFVF